MSNAYDPQPAAPAPRHRQPAPPRPSLIGTLFRVLFVLFIIASFGLNVLLLSGLLLAGIFSQSGALGEDPHLNERFPSALKTPPGNPPPPPLHTSLTDQLLRYPHN